MLLFCPFRNNLLLKLARRPTHEIRLPTWTAYASPTSKLSLVFVGAAALYISYILHRSSEFSQLSARSIYLESVYIFITVFYIYEAFDSFCPSCKTNQQHCCLLFFVLPIVRLPSIKRQGFMVGRSLQRMWCEFYSMAHRASHPKSSCKPPTLLAEVK